MAAASLRVYVCRYKNIGTILYGQCDVISSAYAGLFTLLLLRDCICKHGLKLVAVFALVIASVGKNFRCIVELNRHNSSRLRVLLLSFAFASLIAKKSVF